MKIVPHRMVPLGYGRFFRSDRIAGLEPIEDDRGPGRRTWVHVEGLAQPIVGSRSESAILRDLVEPAEGATRSEELRQLLDDVLDTLEGLDPVLRRIVRDQAGWDLNRLEERLRAALGEEPG
jgi:hypothetical protein